MTTPVANSSTPTTTAATESSNPSEAEKATKTQKIDDKKSENKFKDDKQSNEKPPLNHASAGDSSESTSSEKDEFIKETNKRNENNSKYEKMWQRLEGAMKSGNSKIPKLGMKGCDSPHSLCVIFSIQSRRIYFKICSSSKTVARRCQCWKSNRRVPTSCDQKRST
jgi:hypothetical protein